VKPRTRIHLVSGKHVDSPESPPVVANRIGAGGPEMPSEVFKLTGHGKVRKVWIPTGSIELVEDLEDKPYKPEAVAKAPNTITASQARRRLIQRVPPAYL
jgi:hypothetical protein